MTAIIPHRHSGDRQEYLCRQGYLESPTMISLDVLKTRKREKGTSGCLSCEHESFVIDNTNASVAERQRFIAPAGRGYTVIGF